MTPPPTHTLLREGRNIGKKKLPTQVFNSDLSHFILKRYQTEHNFEMLLIRWKSLHAPGSFNPNFKLGGNASNRSLNNKLRLTATNTNFQKVVTVE